MSDISASFNDIFSAEAKTSPESSYDSGQEADQNEETSSNVKENRSFWKSQNEILQVE